MLSWSARFLLSYVSEVVGDSPCWVEQPGFKAAQQIILGDQTERLIFTGIGKSGHVAGYLASLFSALRMPAMFLHAGEAMHGDRGVLRYGDVLICISHSGLTAETLSLAEYADREGRLIIAITSSADNPLARIADAAIITGSVKDIMGVPTTSVLAAILAGQLLAVSLADKRGFKQSDFIRLHPGGAIGQSQ